MNKYLLSILLLIISLTLFAQEATEDEDDMDLPDIVIESGELQEFEIEVPLPEGPEMEAAIQAIPLPEYDVEVPQDLEVVLPDEEGIGVRSTDVEQIPQYVFSNITIGGGFVGYVHGAVEVKNLGDYPRFQFIFDYDSLDGFSGRDRGTGYDQSNNLIGLDLELADDVHSFNFDLSYSQMSKGLQNSGNIYEVSGYNLSTDIKYALGFNKNWSLFADFYGNMYSRVPGAPEAVKVGLDYRHENTRYISQAGVGLLFLADYIDLEIRGGYDFAMLYGNTASIEQNIHGDVGANIRPNSQWDISAMVSVLYNESGSVFFPLMLDVVFSPVNELEFQLNGSFKRKFADPFGGLVFKDTLLGPSVLFSNTLQGYDIVEASFKGKYFFENGSTLSAQLKFDQSDNMPVSYTYISSEQGFENNFAQGFRLSTLIEWDWQLPLQFALSGQYLIKIAGLEDYLGDHVLQTEVSWHDEDDTFLLAANVQFAPIVYVLPKCDFSVNIRISDDISVTTGINDVFTFGLDRELQGPFVGPGFYGFAEINVSL